MEDTRWKGEKVPLEKLREILVAHKKWLLLGDPELDPEDLSGANLRRADPKEANLVGANLSGANNFTQAQINKACVSVPAKLPERFKQPPKCPEEEK